MSDEFRPDEPGYQTPLQREAQAPRRDRWLMPLVVAGCSLAGVALGFVLGREGTPHEPRCVERVDERVHERVVAPEFPRHFPPHFDFHFRDFDPHVHVIPPEPPAPPAPPEPPALPRELVVDGCDDGDEDGCTTIIKRKRDGSTVIVKTPRGL